MLNQETVTELLGTKNSGRYDGPPENVGDFDTSCRHMKKDRV